MRVDVIAEEQSLAHRPTGKTAEMRSFFFLLILTYINMNLITDKTKKIQQENFRSYADLREWMSRNRFKNTGYVLDEPWKEYFVERWEKEGQVALTMDISSLPNFMSQPLSIMEKPYQVDIAILFSPEPDL